MPGAIFGPFLGLKTFFGSTISTFFTDVRFLLTKRKVHSILTYRRNILYASLNHG